MPAKYKYTFSEKSSSMNKISLLISFFLTLMTIVLVILGVSKLPLELISGHTLVPLSVKRMLFSIICEVAKTFNKVLARSFLPQDQQLLPI